jgi:amino acid transporter
VKPDVKDMAALVLAAGVAIAVIILAVGAVVHSRAISISEATLLGTVLGAITGALATFLGFRAARPTNGGDVDRTWPSAPTPPTVRPQ